MSLKKRIGINRTLTGHKQDINRTNETLTGHKQDKRDMILGTPSGRSGVVPRCSGPDFALLPEGQQGGGLHPGRVEHRGVP